MDTVIVVLIGMLVPILAASVFYVRDPRAAYAPRIPAQRQDEGTSAATDSGDPAHT